MPPMLFAGIRWVIAGVVFIAVLKWRGRSLPKANEIVHLAVVGLALIGFGKRIGSVRGAMDSERIGRARDHHRAVFHGRDGSLNCQRVPKLNATILTGLIMGLVGVCLIFGEDIKYLTDPNNLIGVLALLGAVIFWSTGSLYSKYVKVDVHPLMGASVQMLMAGIVLSVIGISIGELPRLRFRDQWTALSCLPNNSGFLCRIHLLHLCHRQIALVPGFNLRLHQSCYCAILGMDHLRRKAQFSDSHRCGGDTCGSIHCETRHGQVETVIGIGAYDPTSKSRKPFAGDDSETPDRRNGEASESASPCVPEWR